MSITALISVDMIMIIGIFTPIILAIISAENI